MSGLVWAIKNDELDNVKAALKKDRVDVNAEIQGGRNALHFAADYGHAEIVRYLLEEAGADVNLPDKHGITPLLAAIWENHVETVQLLLSKGAKKNGKSPEGKTYTECAETDEIKVLLK